MDGVVVGGDLSRVGDTHAPVGADAAEVVAHEVDDHVEFGAVLWGLVEIVGVGGCGACAFHRFGGEGVGGWVVGEEGFW